MPCTSPPQSVERSSLPNKPGASTRGASACRYNGGPNSPPESTLFLKALDISGFKSFARPTRLEFTEGITALVGPNGSGKSNVVDAVRWCLGEQSIRDLRGQSAQDVIYAGPRRALGMAEVRMLFERSASDSADLPSDLSVARRLYRSGESEYLVDGRRVRLRDLADALRSIGIDDSEHVVVNQGMADALLSASPMDRRALLEQAAGLAGYRTRRDEARSKLATTRRNVETIETLLAEMEPRLRILRRQSRAVQDRDEARSRLQTRVRQWLAHRWNAVTDEVVTLERERAVVDAERREAVAHVDRLEREAEAALTARRHWEERWSVVDASFHVAERERDEARHALASVAQRLEANRVTIFERTTRLAEATSAARRAAEREDELDRTLANLESRAAAVREELARYESELAAAGAEQEAASRAVSGRAAELHAAHAAHAQVAGQFESRESRRAEDEGRVRDLDRWLAEAGVRLDEAQTAEIAAARALRAVHAELEAHRDAATEAESRAVVAAERLRRTESLRQRVTRTRQEVERRAMAVRRTLETLEPLVAGSPLSRVSVDGGFEEAVVAALAGWQGQPLDCDQEAFLEWRARFAERCASAPMWADTIAHGLLGLTPLAGTMVADTEEEGATHWQAIASMDAFRVGAPPIVVVTRQGVRFDALRVVQPTEDDAGGRYLRARRQAALMERRLAVLARRLDVSVAMREAAAHESAERAAAARTVSDGIAVLRTRVSEATRAADAATRAAAALRDDVNGRTALRSRLAEGLQALDSEIESLRSTVDEARDRVQAAEAAASGDDEAQSVARARLEVLLSNVAERRREFDAIAAQQAAQSGFRRSLEGERARADSEHRRLEAELATLREREAAQLEEEAGGRAALEGAEARLTLAIQRRNEVQATRPADTEPTATLADARRTLSEIIPRHERLLARLETRRSDRDVLYAEIERELQVRPEALPEPDGENVPTAEEIQRLRNRASQYPDADESVIGEAKELEERFAYLREHAEDLRTAADNLHEIMDVADREMRGRFGGAFSAVNEEFSRVFQVMLRGGEAELVQNDDGGVDIRAQLPGKKARSSAAFSGGERSLVATSLLFGVLRIRPTPFCLLDEVDAALDESNVDRYLAALRDISGRTQAIVVTHNRATMAAADTLYGTTMDDEGMTSLLSLRLEAYAAG
jgi:chromosome segregation protein